MDQIKSWNMGAMKGNSWSSQRIPNQMAIRTVINRACKMYANTSDDTGFFANLLNRTKDEVEAET